MTIHKPVLLKESIELLNLKPGMIVVDATLGGGGHSIEILKRIMPGGNLIAIDQDEEAVKEFQIKLKVLKLNLKKENVVLANDNFARLKNILDSLKIKKVYPNTNSGKYKASGGKSFKKIGVGVGAVIADLGISSDQLENAKRGLSFMKDGPLDMRMDLRNKLTAFEIVNSYAEKDLARIIRDYGEEKYAGSIAREIIKKRKIRKIGTIEDLVNIIAGAVPEKYKHGRIPRKSRYDIGTRGRHFATKTFQALRIEVNNELDSLKSFLSQAVEVLAPGGRIAVISFHSGEDRIVKIFFRENARGCVCPSNFPVCRCQKVRNLKIITKKPIVPLEKETKNNPRARSAKLRIAERV